jgi:hypothetical protein
MSKKSKKRQTRKKRTTTQPVGDQVSPRADRTRLSASEFNPDYSQTIKDLKRIGILAGTFFTILVALAFFLR